MGRAPFRGEGGGDGPAVPEGTAWTSVRREREGRRKKNQARGKGGVVEGLRARAHGGSLVGRVWTLLEPGAWSLDDDDAHKPTRWAGRPWSCAAADDEGGRHALVAWAEKRRARAGGRARPSARMWWPWVEDSSGAAHGTSSSDSTWGAAAQVHADFLLLCAMPLLSAYTITNPTTQSHSDEITISSIERKRNGRSNPNPVDGAAKRARARY